ncbi:hypothetical protein BpHYR1_047743 [Brachionus plicatilis]|uniref:Uncharacterized protein n=1 Tax=Brachionus plicatilis TaxID=10195 RepID=A0A3M7R195_BRAPC|nr:hypothetical protein BpHYR1_047743 [Brachionus plicatilis]
MSLPIMGRRSSPLPRVSNPRSPACMTNTQTIRIYGLRLELKRQNNYQERQSISLDHSHMIFCRSSFDLT